jgi:hypothetical protein
MLLVLTEPAQFQKTLDRLLMIEAIRAELTISSTVGACAFAQTRACGQATPDDRFHVLGAQRLAIGLPRLH